MSTINGPPQSLKHNHVKEQQCTDGWKYSWQVAPLQSLLPLFSGKTNIDKPPNNANRIFSETHYLQGLHQYFSDLVFKKKSTKKRNKGMGFAHGSFLLGLRRH